MLDLGKMIDWVKLAPKYLFGIFVASGIFLFLPASWLSYLGLGPANQIVRPWVSSALLVSFSLIVAHLVWPLAGAGRGKIREWNDLRRLTARLRNLAEDEKQTLARYLLDNKKTISLSYDQGLANGLVAAGILFRSSSMGSMSGLFPYTMQPWAWDALRSKPELVGLSHDEISKK